MKFITSKDNQILKRARQLHRRKYRDQYGEFIVEGKRAVYDLLVTNNLLHIMLEEVLYLSGEVKHILERAKERNVPIYIVKDGTPHHLSLTESTQGIWAVGMQNKLTFDHLLTRFEMSHEEYVSLWLFLDRIQDPGNLGTIIRTALGAGVKGIIITKGSVDLYNPKVVRSTMSAISKIPIFTDINEREAKTLISHCNVTSYALTPIASLSYEKVNFKGHVMLLLGNEGNGLTDAYLSIADEQIKIPLLGEIESLNIAIAGAITMFKVVEKNF